MNRVHSAASGSIPVEGVEYIWHPISTAPTDGPAFLVCTDQRNVYVVFRRSDAGPSFMHFVPGVTRELTELALGWVPCPKTPDYPRGVVQ